MIQHRDGDVPEADTVAPEERAYEDNWYRSLKALAEQRQDEDAWAEEIDDHADGAVEVAPSPPGRALVDEAEPLTAEPVAAEPVSSERDTADPVTAEPVTASEPVAGEPVAGEPVADAATAVRERLVSEEFETRAGQLLERLRSIQHLGER